MNGKIEIMLIIAAQSGDLHARDAVIVGHIPWLRGLALRVDSSHICDPDELIAEGAMILQKNMQTWSPLYGARLSTYSQRGVQRAMLDAVLRARSVVTRGRAVAGRDCALYDAACLLSSDTASPDCSTSASELRVILARALDSLPRSRDRRIARLLAIGLRPSEIARREKISKWAVSLRIGIILPALRAFEPDLADFL